MSLDVDLVGVGPVSTVIKQSGLPRFQVTRRGAGRGATPVFECLQNNNADKAAKDFENWANTLLAANPANSVQYDIIIFDENPLEDDDLNDGNKPQARRYRSKKIRFSFVLQNTVQEMGVINGPRYEQPAQPDLSQFVPRSQVDSLIAAEREKMEWKFKFDQLNERLARMEEEEEEEEEEETHGSDAVKFLDKLSGLFNAKKEPEAVINGPDEDSPADKLKRINQAVTILAKHDKNIDKNLMKLAELAERKPDTFQSLLSMLQMY
jgi:hypothetical protein